MASWLQFQLDIYFGSGGHGTQSMRLIVFCSFWLYSAIVSIAANSWIYTTSTYFGYVYCISAVMTAHTKPFIQLRQWYMAAWTVEMWDVQCSSLFFFFLNHYFVVDLLVVCRCRRRHHHHHQCLNKISSFMKLNWITAVRRRRRLRRRRSRCLHYYYAIGALAHSITRTCIT